MWNLCMELSVRQRPTDRLFYGVSAPSGAPRFARLRNKGGTGDDPDPLTAEDYITEMVAFMPKMG
jgi:hypothetical protein